MKGGREGGGGECCWTWKLHVSISWKWDKSQSHHNTDNQPTVEVEEGNINFTLKLSLLYQEIFLVCNKEMVPLIHSPLLYVRISTKLKRCRNFRYWDWRGNAPTILWEQRVNLCNLSESLWSKGQETTNEFSFDIQVQFKLKLIFSASYFEIFLTIICKVLKGLLELMLEMSNERNFLLLPRSSESQSWSIWGQCNLSNR